MAWEIKTYLVISPTPVVVEDPAFASSTVYNAGDTFDRRENNASVVGLLEEQSIIELSIVNPTEGFIQVPGPTGPAGATGPIGTAPLASVLAVGNSTGANDIIITGGQKIMGGRISLGSSTTAALDGDFSAGAGSNDLSWVAATGDINATNGTSSLGWDPAASTVTVSASIDAEAGFSSSNPHPGTSASAGVGFGTAGATVSLKAYGTNHASSANLAALEANTPSTALKVATINSAPVEIWTVNTRRWSVTSAGLLLAGSDNAYDIGIAGMNRPRTIFVATGVHIGQTGGATAAGDLRAGDGVNELQWDASAGNLTVPNLIADTVNPSEHTVLMQQIFR